MCNSMHVLKPVPTPVHRYKSKLNVLEDKKTFFYGYIVQVILLLLNRTEGLNVTQKKKLKGVKASAKLDRSTGEIVLVSRVSGLERLTLSEKGRKSGPGHLHTRQDETGGAPALECNKSVRPSEPEERDGELVEERETRKRRERERERQKAKRSKKQCGGSRTPAQPVSRHLRIGIKEKRVLQHTTHNHRSYYYRTYRRRFNRYEDKPRSLFRRASRNKALMGVWSGPAPASTVPASVALAKAHGTTPWEPYFEGDPGLKGGAEKHGGPPCGHSMGNATSRLIYYNNDS
ncbi:hypothetical protein M0802_010916 [Mischocyttarus mexicanus]|nr:hypothetical protein M0802_010916 [Mischocyttarus mexicanus]